MAAEVNTWEEQTLMVNFSLTPSSSPLTNHQQTTAGHHRNPQTFDSESLIYPGLYSPSGLDVFTILAHIHCRPNPTISLGAVDSSCAVVICDLTRPDQPIIYTSYAFTALTGYTASEVVGRNCRFLQFPPTPPPPPACSPLTLFPTTVSMQYLPLIPRYPIPQSGLPPPRRLFPASPPFPFQTAAALPSSNLLAPQQAQPPSKRPFPPIQLLDPPPLPGSAQNQLPKSRLSDRNGQGHSATWRQRGSRRDGTTPTAPVTHNGKRKGHVVEAQGTKRRGNVGAMDAVTKMREAVRRNQEVQVKVVNYKKTGEAFVNLVELWQEAQEGLLCPWGFCVISLRYERYYGKVDGLGRALGASSILRQAFGLVCMRNG